MLDYHPYITTLFVFTVGYTAGLISAYILTVKVTQPILNYFRRK